MYFVRQYAAVAPVPVWDCLHLGSFSLSSSFACKYDTIHRIHSTNKHFTGAGVGYHNCIYSACRRKMIGANRLRAALAFQTNSANFSFRIAHGVFQLLVDGISRSRASIIVSSAEAPLNTPTPMSGPHISIPRPYGGSTNFGSTVSDRRRPGIGMPRFFKRSAHSSDMFCT